MKSGVKEGKRIRVPIHPFNIQDFDALWEGCFADLGMRSSWMLMDDVTVLHREVENLLNIKDSMAVQELQGPDGKPFLNGYKCSEL